MKDRSRPPCPEPDESRGSEVRSRGPTGTKFLSLVCHTESKTELPLTLAVVAARYPLLDGHTHQVLLCVPVKELMRSGKHSERERYPEFIPDFSVFHCGASVARVKC